jgi:hypothetical protein
MTYFLEDCFLTLSILIVTRRADIQRSMLEIDSNSGSIGLCIRTLTSLRNWLSSALYHFLKFPPRSGVKFENLLPRNILAIPLQAKC